MLTTLADLRAEEIALERQIEAECEALSADMAAIHSLDVALREEASFPVLTIPVELVSEIFINYCRADSVDGSFARRRYKGPVALLLVCRTWAHIAYGTASLWQNISLGLCPVGNGALVLDTWAIRAKALPLSLFLWVEITGEQGRNLSDFGDVLRKHSSRVRHLRLDVGGPDVEFLNEVGPVFSSLEELDLDSYEDPPPIMFLARTPLLRSMSLESTSPYCVDVTWSMLTCITLRGLTIETCLVILNLSRNVASVGLFPVRKATSATLLLLGDRTYSSVQKLTVAEGEEDDDASLDTSAAHPLDFLVLPNLRNLTIEDDADLLPNSLSSFINRSAPPLEELTLKTWPLPPHRYGFCKVLTLRELAIHTLDLHQPTVQFMQLMGDLMGSDPSSLGNLRILRVQCREMDVFKSGHKVLRRVLSAFVRRKRVRAGSPTPCCLSEFTLTTDGSRDIRFELDSDDELRDTLKQLEEFHIRIYVGTQSREIMSY